MQLGERIFAVSFQGIFATLQKVTFQSVFCTDIFEVTATGTPRKEFTVG